MVRGVEAGHVVADESRLDVRKVRRTRGALRPSAKE